MKSIFKPISKLVVGITASAVVWLILYMLLQTRVQPNTNLSSYPPPVDNNVTTTYSPEEICEQWFSYRHALSADKQEFFERRYQDCVSAVKTPVPMDATKLVPTPEGTNIYPFPFFSRSTGVGTITETDFSNLSSTYKVKNNWSGDVNGEEITIYAGALISDPKTGGYLQPEDWKGILVVQVRDSAGNFLLNKSDQYLAPDGSGMVRIIGAEGSNLVLLVNDGTGYLFNINDRQFELINTEEPYHRFVNWGEIFEKGYNALRLDGYRFENYWMTLTNNDNLLMAFAGVQEGTDQGIIVVLETTSDYATILEETMYLIPFPDGIVRIVDATDNELYLVTDSGLVFVFNMDSRSFTQTPPGSNSTAQIITSVDAYLAIPIFTRTPTPTSSTGLVTRTPTRKPTNTPIGAATITPTRTPTKTPTKTLTKTPTPTITPLPTYNPYP